jgi:C4-dicarboxylate-specific signal transduction histidine kinase
MLSPSKKLSDNEIRILQAEIEKERKKNEELQKEYEKLEVKFELSKKMLYKKDLLIIQLEKLSGVGQYVPEIIHKLKNPLMGISGYAELAEIADSKEEMLAQLEKIHPQINRLSTLLGQFRSMVSYSSSEMEKVDLTLNITEALQILELFKPKIFAIQSKFSDTDLFANADPDQLHQVHFNIPKIIFKNLPHDQNRIIEICIKKISKKECIKMSSDNGLVFLSEKRQKKMLGKFDSFILLQYASDMLKISKEDLNNILDEKFEISTIEPASILLSFKIALDIIKRHYGNLIIINENGKTTFNLIIPAYKSEE